MDKNSSVVPLEDVENLIIRKIESLINKVNESANGRIVNSCFNYGKFDGYMDILEAINVEKWEKLLKETKHFRKELLRKNKVKC